MYLVDVASHAENVLIIFQSISFSCHLRTACAKTMYLKVLSQWPDTSVGACGNE